MNVADEKPVSLGTPSKARYFWACLIPFVGFAVCLLFTPHLEFQQDAKGYWKLGSQFVNDGHFSLFNYGPTYRGYSFPLLCFGLQQIEKFLRISDFAIVAIFSAAYFAILCGWLLPALSLKLFNLRPKLWQSLVLSALVFTFWHGFLCYPLTDFFCLFVLVGALNLILAGTTACLFGGGLLLGFAYNMRPAYAIALILSLVFVAMTGFQKDRKRVNGWIAIAAMLSGVILVLMPQAFINHRYYHSWSPLTITTAYSSRGLFLPDMNVGFTMQRAETNAGTNFPTASVFFTDPAGVELLQKAGGAHTFGYHMLFKTALSSPFKLAMLYWRHICNGLDIKYPTVYVPDIYSRFQLLSLVNYSLIYLAIIIVLSESLFRAFTPGRLYVLLVVAAICGVAVPMAAEPRFFLPAYLSLYTLVIFYPKYHSLYTRFEVGQKLMLLTGYVIFLVTYSVYSGGVFQRITARPSYDAGSYDYTVKSN
jgi:hypothetical protein